MQKGFGLNTAISIGIGTAISVSEKNIPAGISFGGAFMILFALLQMNTKRK